MRRIGFLVATAGLCLGFVVVAARPASACLKGRPGVTGRYVYPPADSIVPTNAQFVVQYLGDPIQDPAINALGEDLGLRQLGGERAETEYTVLASERWVRVVLRPKRPLAPRTTYELTDRRTVPCYVDRSDCGQATESVVASFTTGDGPDEAAPVFAGVSGVSVRRAVACSDSSCCYGPYAAHEVELSWLPAQDESGSVMYLLYKADDISLPLASTTLPSLIVDVLCSGHIDANALVVPEGEYVMRAADSAGNEDQNAVAARVSVVCDPFPTGALPIGVTAPLDGSAEPPPPDGSADSDTRVDAPVSPDDSGAQSPDASAESDTRVDAPASPERGGGGGCGCGVAAASPSSAISLLMAAAWLLAPRGRRKRRL